MRNITSYKCGSVFTGSELNAWCKDQLENNKSHKKIAHKIYMHYTFKDNRSYKLISMQYRMYEPATIAFERTDNNA